jgi:hypothetical protein
VSYCLDVDSVGSMRLLTNSWANLSGVMLFCPSTGNLFLHKDNDLVEICYVFSPTTSLFLMCRN